MLADSLTPAQLLALALFSVTGGEHGVSSQDGMRMEGTSDGQKWLEWSSSSDPLSNTTHLLASRSLETTMVSSKGGGRVGVETPKPTESSGEFTNYWKSAMLFSQQDTSTPLKTLPTAHPEGSTHPNISSYGPSNSQLRSGVSLSTTTPPLDLTNQLLLKTLLQNPSQRFPSQSTTGGIKQTTTPMTSQRLPPKCPCLLTALE